MYSMIVTDVDGTLIKTDLSVNRTAAEALRKASSIGIVVAIDSGRYPGALGYIWDELSLERVYSAMNGALVRVGNETIFSSPFDYVALSSVSSLLKGRADAVIAFESDSYYIDGTDSMISLQEKIYGEKGTRRRITDIESDRIYKILVKDFDTGKIAGLLNDLSELNPPVNYASSSANTIEINAFGTDKGTGVEELGRYYGIPSEEIIAFGDHDNDIPMFEKVGLPIAMMNGSETALRKAGYITLSNDDDGISSALEKFVFSG